MSKAIVVSMYSFKGGAGRTLCTANLAPRLAQRFEATEKAPILLLDLDLDSTGLSILLSENSILRQSDWNSAKFLADEFNLGIINNDEVFQRKGLLQVSGALAGCEMSSALRLLVGPLPREQQSYDISGFDMRNAMGSLLRFANRRNIPLILIDSASGLQPTAILSHEVSDIIVYCCRLTTQFVHGTQKHLSALVERSRAHGSRPRILLLPVAVPVVTEDWRNTYHTRLDDLRQTRIELNAEVDIDIVDPAINEEIGRAHV